MSKEPVATTEASPVEQRRNFVAEVSSLIIGGLVGLVPVLAGMVFALNPLIRKPATAEGEGDGFRKITNLSSVPGDGTPQIFKVVGTKVDAWTTYPETELGAVYLRMKDGKVECFNARCPHLGCTVGYKPDQQVYICPCHDSSFTVSGERNNEIPPRSLDALDVDIRNETEVWVKFQNFRAGQAERVCV